jgi:hypothetical protein
MAKPLIRARLDVDTKPVAEITHFLDSFNELVAEIGNEVGQDVAPRFKAAMQLCPPPRPNQRYKRTFRLRRETKVSYSVEGGRFQLEASNTTPYYRYVKGVFDFRSFDNAVKPQAWMHKDRWIPAQVQANQYFDEAQTKFNAGFDKAISDKFGTTAAKRRSVRR